jgi:DNA integrity scanning protein DisA with diadenylate cyclase activity
MDALTKSIIEKGASVAKEVNANAILLYADVIDDPEKARRLFDGCGDLVIVTYRDEEYDKAKLVSDKIVQVPAVSLTRIGQMKMAVLIACSKKVLKKGDVIVCLAGIDHSGTLDTLLVMDIGGGFELFGGAEDEKLYAAAMPGVFQRVIELASKIGVEGREGKPVGAIFAIGDTEKVMQNSKQMILNPVKGYSREERNILDPALEETVKELSTIDGAFVITADGVIEAVGRYLIPSDMSATLPQGLGARHQAAASITKATDALAVAVSESTGNVSVFKGGEIVMEIEKPRRQAGPPIP